MNGLGDEEGALFSRLAEVLDEHLARVAAGLPSDVEALVASHPDLGDDLRDALASLDALSRAVPAESSPAARVASEDRGERRLGDFRILREVGRGGMGVVYEAVQISLNRRVALKVLPFASVLDPRALQRFQNEALAAAQLHHTNIVPVHSVGCESGVHYYAMQFIEGESLARAIGELRRARAARDASPARAPTSSSPLSPVSSHAHADAATWSRLVARLGLQAAEALAYAHQVGVVHRDVKPANLLVDRAANLWVTDFGLARVSADASVTASGGLVGTARYMSPEQARGLPADHRSDVYSLGATLYEMLALEPAFPGDDQRAVLEAVIGAEPAALRRRSPAIPADLETIVLKAMSKEPSGRYETAADLAEDLRRFLASAPIRARRPSLGQRTALWARRHRSWVGVGAVATVLLIASLATAAVLISHEKARTEAALVRARADHQAADEARDHARASGLVNAAALARSSDPVLSLLLAREAARTSPTPEATTALRDALGAALEVTRIPGDRTPLASATFSARGDRILTVGVASVARLWDTSGRAVATIPGGIMPAPAAISPRGDVVLAASRWQEARLWDVDGRPRALLSGHEGLVIETSFSPSGDRCLTVSNDGTARVWDLEGRSLAVIRSGGGSIQSAAFLPAGDGILAVTSDGRAVVFEAKGEERLALGEHGGGIRGAIASPTGDRFLTLSDDSTARVWDLDGREVAVLRGHQAPIRRAAYDANGACIATASEDGTARLWDASGKPLAVCRGHTEALTSVEFSPTGEAIVTASVDRTARVFDVDGREVAVLRGHEQPVSSAVFSREGDRVLTASLDRTARVWDLAPVEPRRVDGARVVTTAVALSATGDRLAVGFEDGTVRLRDGTGREIATHREHRGAVRSASFSPDGTHALTTSADGTARVWDASGSLRGVLRGHRDEVTCGAWAPSGGEALTGSRDGTARLWDASGREIAPLRGHEAPVVAVSFLGGTDLVLTASTDSTARVWDRAGNVHAILRGPRAELRGVAGSPSGERIVTWSVDGTARLWGRDGRELAVLRRHDGPVTAAVFSPDGRLVLTAGADRVARLWDEDGRVLAELRGHTSAVVAAAFSPAGDLVITASLDGTARVWDLEGRPLDVLRAPGGPVSWAAISPTGRQFLTGGPTSGVLLWTSRVDDILGLAEVRILRDFTRAEREDRRDLLGPDNAIVLEAHAIVEALSREVVLSAEVCDRVRSDASLSPELRQAGLRIASRRRDDPDLLNREAWSVVRVLGKDPDEYGRALRIARAVVRLAPDDWAYLNTLGTAQYRVGADDDAVKSLERAEALRSSAGRSPAAEDLAVMAMAHHRRGRTADARALADRLRRLLAEPASAGDAGALAFQAELEHVLGSE